MVVRRSLACLLAASMSLGPGVASTASAQPPIVVYQDGTEAPPQAAPQPLPEPQPPAQYGGGPGGAYQTSDGTTWVPVPSGYRLVLAPAGQPQGVPYANVTPPGWTQDMMDQRIDRAVRRARRWGYVQIVAGTFSLVSLVGALSCEAEGSYCEQWWGMAALGFLGFAGAGVGSALSANRAAGLVEQSGIPIRRGSGRWAVALSFVPYANIGAFALTSVTLGRVRRARAQAQQMRQPVQQSVPYPAYGVEPAVR